MTVTIFDDENPKILTAAKYKEVECDGEGNLEDYMNWLANNGGAKASDSCTATEDLVWTNDAESKPMSDGCGETGEKTVVFTVTDACGNNSKTYATFRIVDTVDPETTPAYNKTVVCDGSGNLEQFQDWLADNGGATAKDECSGVTWSNSFPADPKAKDFDISQYLEGGCSTYTGHINVVFTVTDACGNDVDLPATFTIEDSIAPEMTPASDMIVECDGSIVDYWKELENDSEDANGIPQGTNAYDLQMWLNNHGGATATDGCSNVKWTKDINVYGDSCDTEYRVIFTATDECGNKTSTTASFHVQDTLSPMIGQEAMDLELECGYNDTTCDRDINPHSPFEHWLHTNGGAQAMDLCDKSLTWTNDYDGKGLSDECGNTGRVTVTFTVTDNCGLSSSTSAEFRIVDTTAPNMRIPSDYYTTYDEKCEYDISPYGDAGMAQAWDACGEVDVTYTDETDKGSCVTIVTRTWKATDDCGNVTTDVQKITIEDTMAPVYTGNVGQFNLSNVDACEPPAAPSLDDIAAQFSDNCGSAIATLVDTITISDSTCDWAVQFVYEIKDKCDNIYDGTVKVTYWGSDQTMPNLIAGEELPKGDSGINACLADALEANPAMDDDSVLKLFEDNCSDKLTAKSELHITEDGCKWAFHYTYTVTDECGNDYSFDQHFSGEDNTAPVLVGTIPSDMSNLDACKDTYEGPSEAEIKELFHDSCGINVVKNIHRSGTDCNWLNSFEYTVTDECGNAYPTFKVIYTGRDQSAPEVNEPYKLYTVNMSDYPGVTCPDDVELGLTEGQTLTQDETFNIFGITDINLSLADATDNCTPAGDIKFNITSVVKGGDACRVVFTIAYTVEDNCGNTTQEYNKFFRLVDDVAPVIDEAPEDITVQCIEDVPAMISLNWVDNCQGGGTVEGEDGKLVGDTCGGTITRTWNIKDACGNEAVTRTQIITIKDTTNPVIEIAAADKTVECVTAEDVEAQVWINELHYDNTGGDVNEFVEVVANFDASGYELVLYNGSNGTSYATKSLSYQSTNSGFNFYTADHSGIQNGAPDGIALVNGSDVIEFISYEGSFTALDGPANGMNSTDIGVSEGSGTSSDGSLQLIGAGNKRADFAWADPMTNTKGSVNNEQTLTQAGSNPNLEALNAWLASNGGATASDNCTAANDLVWTNNFTGLSESCGNSGSAVVTFTAQDECGNKITTTATFTIKDTTKPTASNPSDINVECSDDVPNPDATVVTDEEDNCSTPTVTWVKDESDNGSCPEIITRTYKVEDACGNSIEVTQKIIIKDVTNPVLASAPKDIIVSCLADVPAMTSLDWTDNCDAGGSVQGEDSALEGDACNGTITRTWNVTDACGNAAETRTQIITIKDATKPTASNPSDINVECSDDVPNPDATVVTDADDNCSTPTVTWVKDESDNGSCSEIITRIYKVEDACGNSIEVTQKIIINDETKPVIVNCPDDVDFGEVTETPIFAVEADITATDNCDPDPVVTYVDTDDSTYVPGAPGSNDPGSVYKFTCQNGPTSYHFTTFVWDGTTTVVGSSGPQANYTPVVTGQGTYTLTFEEGVDNPDSNPVESLNDWVLRLNGQLIAFKNSQNNNEFPDCDANWNETNYMQNNLNCKILRVDCIGDVPEPGVTNYMKIRTFTATDDCGNESDLCSVVYTWSIVDSSSASSANDYDSGVDTTVDFRAYPVPFNGEVTIAYNFDFDTNVKVEVYDTKGMLVLSKDDASYMRGTDATMPLSINGSDQMYYIKVITSQGTMTKKVVATSGN
ncbi:T9SS type A sorting domain-containing protein [Pontimicrobium aquaticum]|nr:T9SS type A sorting domain-containing protein [Pontimicrobium aquaticum]